MVGATCAALQQLPATAAAMLDMPGLLGFYPDDLWVIASPSNLLRCADVSATAIQNVSTTLLQPAQGGANSTSSHSMNEIPASASSGAVLLALGHRPRLSGHAGSTNPDSATEATILQRAVASQLGGICAMRAADVPVLGAVGGAIQAQ